jgi:short subunit dehydrogenase-like uncharacterized protein
MPDVLLFGATGYTGRLTAKALARRGASFVLAGRDASKLATLQSEVGADDVRVAAAGDVDALERALRDVRVMITCVGPFMKLGETAVQAALRAGVHYVDSTGEGPFIRALIDSRHDEAVRAGIVIAPAMGFDEVPGDVVATMAAAGMTEPELMLTYAIPSSASAGTLRSILDIIASPGNWIIDGRPYPVRAGESDRWAPMPPPLGPRRGTAFPLAIGHLAPLHLDLATFKTFVTVGPAERIGLKALAPSLRMTLRVPGGRNLLERLIERAPDGPDEATRSSSKFTILGEAMSRDGWRNVALTGTDHYGITAELLAAAALRISEDGYDTTGVRSPVGAVGLELLQSELEKHGCEFATWQSN